MTSVNQNIIKNDKSFSEKLQLYWEKHPRRCCDICFVVGSGEEKQVIETSRIILEIACPEFMRLFDENCNQLAVKNEELGIKGIVFPDIDPQAFKIFLKLLMSDNVSVDSLKRLRIPPRDLLNVIELCGKYSMRNIQQNLEVIAHETLFGRRFSSFWKTEEFLLLTKSNLNTMLQSNTLDASETEIFDAAIRWAEKQCSGANIENTGENIREILGDSFFRIRFPTMSSKEFTSNSRIQKILTEKEQLDIIRHIIAREQTSTIEQSILEFDKSERIRDVPIDPSIKTLQLLTGFQIVNDRPFVCDGSITYGFCLKVDRQIEISSFGFLGPIECDSFYDVTVEITTRFGALYGELKKRVFARKNEKFHVYFDEPLKMNANAKLTRESMKSWKSECYRMYFSLKGPNTSVVQLGFGFKDLYTQTDEGVGFFYRVYNFPLAEIRFKKC